MCATEEQFPRLNRTASINLKPRICYFLRVLWQPSCFWYIIWSVTTVTSSPSNDSKSPADLAHAASDVGVHHDYQERHEDQVGVAENIFQHEQLKPVKMIETKGKQIEKTKIILNRLSVIRKTWKWPPRPDRDLRDKFRWRCWPAHRPGTGVSACWISPLADSWFGVSWLPGKSRARQSARALRGQE